MPMALSVPIFSKKSQIYQLLLAYEVMVAKGIFSLVLLFSSSFIRISDILMDSIFSPTAHSHSISRNINMRI